MAYTFAQFKSDCNEVLWPNGVPENMVTAIDRFYTEAMVDVQRFAPCYRNRNETVYEQCSTLFQCGTTVLDAPDGRITRVYVVDGDEYCQPVTYAPTDLYTVKCWSRRFAEIVNSPTNEGLTPPPLGYRYPESTTDSQYGRAFYGKWSLDSRGSGTRIVIAPWIQSTEKVVVEWSGIKATWEDADLVAEDDVMLTRAVRAYVRWMYESLYVCDRMNTKQCRDEYDEALAELIHECKRRTRIPKPEVCNDDQTALLATYSTPTTTNTTTNVETTVLAAFGDYGVDDENELAVANLVKSWNPDGILALGDNNYETGSASTIDTNVGKYYADFIYPYIGSYDSSATENKFWPVLGNHDLDTSNGQPYLDYFPQPINQRYYDTVIGNVHIFALNSGYNTAGTMVETAGNDGSSAQATWLRNRLLKSTAKWKIVILHHPPYTNGSSYTPGYTALRWPFEEWGVDAVLSGHSHVYERIEKGSTNFPYIVAGTGGKTLDTFIGSPVDQAIGYNAMHGALKITATCSTLAIEFYNKDGELIDSGTGGDGGYVPPPSSFTVYYGRSTNTILTGPEIIALSNSSVATTHVGSFSYASGSGYLYYAVPDTRNPAAIRIGSFDVPLAGVADGYTGGSGLMTYQVVSVSGTNYRLYRTYNTTAGSTTLIVT